MNETRLAELIQQWMQGVLTDAELAELEQQMRNDPAARLAFLRAANLDSALRDRAARDDRVRGWIEELSLPRRRSRWIFPWAAATAATIVGLSGAYLAGNFSPHPSRTASEATAQGAAILTQTIDADWGAGRAQQNGAGTTLSPGVLTLHQGLVQIEFFSGAALVVAAPAEFEIVSPWKVTWRHGKARIKVPPAARGFEVATPGLKVIDLGTEFGLDVDRASAGARLQVFSGEVEAHPLGGKQMNLKTGDGIEQRGSAISALTNLRLEDFPGVERMRELGRARDGEQFERWQQFSRAQRRDPRLIAYYPLQQETSGQRLVRNLAEPGDALRDGGAVGAAWTTGRWPQKHALEFKGAGDRVRLQIDGEYRAVTLACWVRVDGLDRTLNALLLTDGFEPGEPHWQIAQTGQVRFAIAYPSSNHAPQLRRVVFETPVVFDPSQAGRWRHLAVTYDAVSGEGVHYVDGREVSRRSDSGPRGEQPIVFGAAEIGNWGLPLEIYKFPIRNLNGRIDEFSIFSAALGAQEIRAMYEAGRPE